MQLTVFPKVRGAGARELGNSSNTI